MWGPPPEPGSGGTTSHTILSAAPPPELLSPLCCHMAPGLSFSPLTARETSASPGLPTGAYLEGLCARVRMCVSVFLSIYLYVGLLLPLLNHKMHGNSCRKTESYSVWREAGNWPLSGRGYTHLPWRHWAYFWHEEKDQKLPPTPSQSTLKTALLLPNVLISHDGDSYVLISHDGDSCKRLETRVSL